MINVSDEAVIEANRAAEALDAKIPAEVLRAVLEAAAPHIAYTERQKLRTEIGYHCGSILRSLDRDADGNLPPDKP